jgi:UDP-glucose 4-epimerase
VTEVIDAARQVTGRTIRVRDDPQRAGDPPILVADVTRAKKDLGWTPQYLKIDTIIDHAWQWESATQQLRQLPQLAQLASP